MRSFSGAALAGALLLGLALGAYGATGDAASDPLGGKCLSLSPDATGDAVSLSSAVPDVSFFQEALVQTGTAEDLAGRASITVFAPANEVYQAIAELAAEDQDIKNYKPDSDPTSYWQAVLSNHVPQQGESHTKLSKKEQKYHERAVALLTKSVNFHVVDGALTIDDLRNVVGYPPSPQQLQTLLGQPIEVELTDDNLTLVGPQNDANAVIADIPLCNGVLFIIDSELIPDDIEDNVPALDGGRRKMQSDRGLLVASGVEQDEDFEEAISLGESEDPFRAVEGRRKLQHGRHPHHHGHRRHPRRRWWRRHHRHHHHRPHGHHGGKGKGKGGRKLQGHPALVQKEAAGGHRKLLWS